MILYQDKYSIRPPSSANDLADRIEADVANGELVSGDRLPPVRELANIVSLAPNTVATAYRRLADRGVVVSRGRLGTFVLERPPLGQYAAPPIPPGVIDLASGNPDVRLLPDLGPHLPRGKSTLYSDPLLVPELDDAARAWLGGQGVVPGRLAVTSGALDAIERILVTHLRAGDAVAVERPGWSAVNDVVRALGMRPVEIDTDDRGMIPDSLAVRLGSVDAVVLTPRAQNPMGSAFDEERHRDLARTLSSRPELLVVEDDHCGPVAGAELISLGRDRRRWALVQSMAKSLGPDLRLALVTGDDLTVDRVVGRFGLGPGWVSRILQWTVASMLTDPEVGALLKTAEESYRARRDALVDGLAEAGIAGATGRSGLNVWVPVASEQAAIDAAAGEGFAVRAGAPFGSHSPAVRITVSNLDPVHIPALVGVLSEPTTRGGRLV
jgi:DNA-binding transcriptional MocR family regulator